MLEGTQLHCLLSPVEEPCCAGKGILRLLSICTHNLGMFPSRRITLGTARLSEQWSLPVLYLLPCSFATVYHHRPEYREAPGQTGMVHRELDRLSLLREAIETDYHITVLSISISLPPENATKKIFHLYRLLSAEYKGLLENDFNKRIYFHLWQTSDVSYWLCNF